MSDSLILWPLNYLLHSTVLLLAAWAIERWLHHPRWSEWLWRAALIGSVLTATVQPWFHTNSEASASAPTAVIASAPATQHPYSDGKVAELRRTTADAASTPPVGMQPRSSPALAVWRLPGNARLVLAALSFAWLLIVVAGLVMLVLQWLRLRIAVLRMPVCTVDHWLRRAQRVATRYGRPAPRLRVSSRAVSPFVAPGGDICLPNWALEQLDALQCDAVLAHEIAHLQRRDLAWNLAAQAVRRIGWLQPLNRLALRRLDYLAELACDELASESPDRRLALAEALRVCAMAQLLVSAAGRSSRARRATLQLCMARDESSLVQRIRLLLQGSTSIAARGRKRLWWLLVVPVSVLIFLPLIQFNGALPASLNWHNALNYLGSPSTVISYINPGYQLKVRIDGHVTVSEKADAMLIDHGRIRIHELKDGHTRDVTWASADDGAVTRSYDFDGQTQTPDGAAEQWIADRQLFLMQSLLGPDRWVKRLLSRGGPEAVVSFIATTPARAAIAKQDLIRSFCKSGTLDQNTLQRLLEISRDIPSDNDRSGALKAIAEEQRLSVEQQVQWLQLAAELDSEGLRSETMMSLAPRLADDPKAAAAWRVGLGRLDGDRDRSQLLQAVLARDDLSASQLQSVLEDSVSLHDDSEHRTLLEQATRRPALNSPALIGIYAESARTLQNSGDRRVALLALIHTTALGRAGDLAVLQALNLPGASHDVAEVLEALALNLDPASEVISAYRLRERQLEATDRGHAEEALDHLNAI
jgi:beta-lactamase regulating signal transducer with metallopeptidase domain